jgi:hypothetical protein
MAYIDPEGLAALAGQLAHLGAICPLVQPVLADDASRG